MHLNLGLSTLGVVFDCDGPCTAAEITGGIPHWSSEGVITVRALPSGTERIRATSHTFGVPPTIEIIGTVVVGPGEPRRRSVRH